MRSDQFKAWLAANHTPSTAATYYSEAKRVEGAYGDLDDLYDAGEIETLATQFNYSTKDAKDRRPNPTQLPAGSNLYANLASLKNAVRSYARFRNSELEMAAENAIEIAGQEIKEKREGKQFEVERHLQENIRTEIGQLECGLAVIDGGSERSVESGFIDILARDTSGALVVVELKAGLAKREAIGQIAGYIGDLMAEEPDTPVRGILVAADFDKSCQSAVRAIGALKLVRYRFSFTFEDIF